MKTIDSILIPPDMGDMQEAADKAAKGIRDPEEARKAAATVDRIREENRRRFGDQPIGVEIIRAFRGPLSE
jgi:hypothetical protein